MAVGINNVYKKVLSLANKEQRGYITPHEFNTFADQAQLEIFEQYFYDKNQFSRVKGNESEYSDMISNLDEKISIFESTAPINSAGEINAADFYRLGTVIFAGTSGAFGGGTIVEEVQQNEILNLNRSLLMAPTSSRPVYIRVSQTVVQSFPDSTMNDLSCTYIKKPKKPQWGYVVINGRAMYDGDATVTSNFELHSSEENELVYRILKLAGIAIKRNDISSAGQGLEVAQVQQEKQ
tara:strand:- start:14492 stop:15202 length:711 start_codon:yes stop_codon:yes gene_type:complete